MAITIVAVWFANQFQGGRIKMAARKTLLKRAPERPRLRELIAASIAAGVSDEQLLEQRISFAYGNAPEGSRITKDSVRMASSRIKISR